MADSQDKLSIIVLSWNSKNLLKGCLKSLGEGCGSVDGCKVIIVDNGSTDGSKEYLKSQISKLKTKTQNLKLIFNKENVGFAKGNNIGIKEAKSEYIMLLNSDTIVQPGAIKILLDFLDRYHTCQIAASPLLVLPNGEPQFDYYMKFPNLWQIFLYHSPVLRPIVRKIPFLSSLIAQKDQDMPFEVDQLPGAALLAHRDIWQKVGLLNEDYRFLFEDVDWCWRAKKNGIRLMVVPEARIVHFGGASWKKKLKENSTEFYYQFFSSMLLFVRKNYPKIQSKIFKWAIILNFLLTLKLLLAKQFLENDGRQKNYLIQ